MPEQSSNEEQGQRIHRECATCSGTGVYPVDTDDCDDCAGLGEWWEATP